MKIFGYKKGKFVENKMSDNCAIIKHGQQYSFHLYGNIEFLENAIKFLKLNEIKERCETSFPELTRFADSLLCYVSPYPEHYDRDFIVAYFTTQDIIKQRGDDWDDCPYELNASPPSDYIENHDKEKFSVIRVKFNIDDCETNSGEYCVLDLNEKVSYWLKIKRDYIFAGITLIEFLEVLQKHGKTFEVWEGFDESKNEW